jgi:hypothetical protein
MYSQEVHDIIERLKERVKDDLLADDLNMLSLYSEMRSNALYELEKNNKSHMRNIQSLMENLDSAEAAFDNMEMSNKTLKGLLLRATTDVAAGRRRPSSDDDED